MSLITKVFSVKGNKFRREYMIQQGGLTHPQAKARAKSLRKRGFQARIASHEGQWATWIRRYR